VLGDESPPSDFVAAYPELLAVPKQDSLEKVLELIQMGQYEDAEDRLQKLEGTDVVLPVFLHLRSLFY
jgi:uncharacterized pyridoxal phosphate-containing UPF0001 family protein